MSRDLIQALGGINYFYLLLVYLLVLCYPGHVTSQADRGQEVTDACDCLCPADFSGKCFVYSGANFCNCGEDRTAGVNAPADYPGYSCVRVTREETSKVCSKVALVVGAAMPVSQCTGAAGDVCVVASGQSSDPTDKTKCAAATTTTTTTTEATTTEAPAINFDFIFEIVQFIGSLVIRVVTFVKGFLVYVVTVVDTLLSSVLESIQDLANNLSLL